MTADGRGPLHGRRVAVTRPRERAAALVAALEGLGATVLATPAVAVAPPASWEALDAALARLADYHWLALTSAAAVDAVADRLAPLRAAALPPVAAVGAATARAARERLGRVDLVPATHTADALGDALPAVRGARVLFPCADRARDALPDVLRARGAVVDRVVAYRTLPSSPEALAECAAAAGDGTLDAVLLASPSAADAMAQACGAALAAERGPAVVCIGPTTADACRTLGLRVAAVADSPSDEALVYALLRALRASSDASSLRSS